VHTISSCLLLLVPLLSLFVTTFFSLISVPKKRTSKRLA